MGIVSVFSQLVPGWRNLATNVSYGVEPTGLHVFK